MENITFIKHIQSCPPVNFMTRPNPSSMWPDASWPGLDKFAILYKQWYRFFRFIQCFWATGRASGLQKILENDQCIHRQSNISNIGRQTAHRTSDCYMAPIPILSHSAARRVNAACLLTLGSANNCSTLNRVKHPYVALCLISVQDIWSHMSDACGAVENGVSEEG